MAIPSLIAIQPVMIRNHTKEAPLSWNYCDNELSDSWWCGYASSSEDQLSWSESMPTASPPPPSLESFMKSSLSTFQEGSETYITYLLHSSCSILCTEARNKYIIQVHFSTENCCFFNGHTSCSVVLENKTNKQKNIFLPLILTITLRKHLFQARVPSYRFVQNPCNRSHQVKWYKL